MARRLLPRGPSPLGATTVWRAYRLERRLVPLLLRICTGAGTGRPVRKEATHVRIVVKIITTSKLRKKRLISLIRDRTMPAQTFLITPAFLCPYSLVLQRYEGSRRLRRPADEAFQEPDS